MWEKLEAIFQTIGLPYSRQGSYEEGADLPDSFFTFWNYDTPNIVFYDNEVNKKNNIWNIYFYTNDNSLLYSKLNEFIIQAKTNGFIVNGNGKDIPSDIPNYFGRYVVINDVETTNNI